MAVALAAGCSSSSDENLGRTQLAAFMNEKTVYDYFVGKGLTNFQAAGVVGNLIQESHLDPTIHQYNNGPGRGLAQWSAGARWDTTPGDNVKDFAAEHGNQDVYSLGLQLDFIWYELTTFSNYGLAELKASTTLEQATQVFEDKFEGCVYANFPVCALPQRVEYAKDILDAYGDSPGAGGSGGGGAGGAGTAGAGGTGAGGAAGASAGAAGNAGGGTSSVAGNTSGGSGGASTGSSGSAGAPTTTGGNPSGGSGTAGAPGVAGSAPFAGSSAAGAGLVTPPSTAREEGGCSVSTAEPRTGSSPWLVLGLASAGALRSARRRRRG